MKNILSIFLSGIKKKIKNNERNLPSSLIKNFYPKLFHFRDTDFSEIIDNFKIGSGEEDFEDREEHIYLRIKYLVKIGAKKETKYLRIKYLVKIGAKKN